MLLPGDSNDEAWWCEWPVGKSIDNSIKQNHSDSEMEAYLQVSRIGSSSTVKRIVPGINPRDGSDGTREVSRAAHQARQVAVNGESGGNGRHGGGEKQVVGP
jgi:hypothetical protein